MTFCTFEVMGTSVGDRYTPNKLLTLSLKVSGLVSYDLGLWISNGSGIPERFQDSTDLKLFSA